MNAMKLIFKTFFLSLAMIANIHFAYAQSQGGIIPNGLNVFLDNNGKPLSSGKVFFYIGNVGSTTPKTTYSDINLTTPNTNPVILDAAGRPNGSKGLWGTGTYRQVVQDKNSNVIWDVLTSAAGSGAGGGSAATGDGDLVGTIKPWAGPVAPSQYMFTYGQELSRTTFLSLFTAITSVQNVFCTSGSAVLSGVGDTTNFWVGMSLEIPCVLAGFTTVVSKTASSITMAANANVSTSAAATFFMWGRGNGTTTFNLPDFRGLIPMGNNIMGGVASSNISDANFGSQLPESAGGTGGAQTKQLDRTNLPTGITSTIPNLISGVNLPATNGAITDSQVTAGSGLHVPTTSSWSTQSTISGTATSSNTGSGGVAVAFPIIPPTKTVNFIIKVTPDTSSPINVGVTAIQSMTGNINCGTGLLCTGNVISVASSQLAVGGSVISAGSNTNILFNNNNVLGEYTISGSGTAVAMANSPVLITPTLGVASATSLTLATALSVLNGGTGSTTAIAARQSLNVWGDAGTGHGNVGVTIGNTERFAFTNAAFTASRAWVLPAANVTGQSYAIQISDMAGGVTASNTLVITRAGADTINGGTTATISAANGGYMCYSDGSSKWSCLSMGAASAGGVTSITAGAGLSGGTITTSGTIAVTNQVLLATLTASSSATLSDTSSLTNAYSAYDIVFANILPVTNNVSCEIQVHSSASFQATGYLTTAYGNTNGGAMAFLNSSTFIPCSIAATVGGTGASGVSGTIRVSNPSASALHNWNGQFTAETGAANQSLVNVGSVWNTSAVVDGFQVLFSSGNIASGTVKIYGIQ